MDKLEWTVLLLLSFVPLAWSVFEAVHLPYMSKHLTSNYGVSANAVAWLFAIYSLMTVVLGAPVGYLLDHPKISRMLLLSGGTLALTLSTVFFGLSEHSLWQLFVSRSLQGAAYAFAGGATYACAAEWFPQDATRVLGVLELSSGIGYMIGPVVGGNVYTHAGDSFVWPYMAVSAATLVLILPVFFALHVLKKRLLERRCTASEETRSIGSIANSHEVEGEQEGEVEVEGPSINNHDEDDLTSTLLPSQGRPPLVWLQFAPVHLCRTYSRSGGETRSVIVVAIDATDGSDGTPGCLHVGRLPAFHFASVGMASGCFRRHGRLGTHGAGAVVFAVCAARVGCHAWPPGSVAADVFECGWTCVLCGYSVCHAVACPGGCLGWTKQSQAGLDVVRCAVGSFAARHRTGSYDCVRAAAHAATDGTEKHHRRRWCRSLH
ncbi:MAG: hypothetical protein MHM6MM_002865 [Cercozoa sp. M6MM]